MFRWAGWARVVLILLILVVAILVPVVVSGYVDIQRGDVAMRGKDYFVAAPYYAFASEKLPWRPDLLERAAMAESNVNFDRAIVLFERAQSRQVLSAAGWYTYGEIYWVSQRYDVALDIWLRGVKRYPSYVDFYYMIQLAYRQLGDSSDEQLWLQKWLSTGKGGAIDHYHMGLLLMGSDPSRAEREFRLAASMYGGFEPAAQTLNASLALASLETTASRRFVMLGRGLGLVDEWRLAQYDFQQAVNADSKNAEAWAWLGEAQQQNNQEGKAALDKALELDPNSSLVHGLRGLYWKRHGMPKAALAEYLAAAQLEPKNAQWQVALGDAYASTGDLVQALAAYVTATDLAPDNATYWRLLALFSADNGVQVLDVGLPAAKKAAEIAPDDAQVLDTLGWTYAQAGLLNTAEQTLNKALKIAPDSAAAHLHLAETYLREGQASFAQTELKRVVQLDANGPSGTFAAQLLKQYFP